MTGDLTSFEQVEAVRTQVEAEHGPADVPASGAAAWITGVILDVAGGAVLA